MKAIVKILLAIIVAVACGCISRVAADGVIWRNQAEKVTMDMPRSEVEKWLPPHPSSLHATSKSGGSQYVMYWVDENWHVAILYDYTGIPRDEKGMALSLVSPENKVKSKPVLSRKPMPVFEFKTMKTAEKSNQREE